MIALMESTDGTSNSVKKKGDLLKRHVLDKKLNVISTARTLSLTLTEMPIRSILKDALSSAWYHYFHYFHSARIYMYRHI